MFRRTGWEEAEETEEDRQGHIVLIPKKGDQFLVSNKHPLTLLNVIYKIWAKAYQLRLSKVLNRFISYHQSAFLPGRSIHHSVLLRNEILHRVALSGLDFALLKLDICKAFDKTEWDFLIALLEHIGFGPNFIRFIIATMANTTSAVIINGHQSEPFKISQSMRQGCPPSPLLFIIVVDALSQMLELAMDDGHLKGLRLEPEGLHFLHGMYADNVNIVLEATSTNILRCKQLFGIFGQASGLLCN